MFKSILKYLLLRRKVSDLIEQEIRFPSKFKYKKMNFYFFYILIKINFGKLQHGKCTDNHFRQCICVEASFLRSDDEVS